MPAAFVTLAAFFGWWAIGLALLAALRADVRSLRLALAAPVLGSAVTVVPLFFLSNLGVPMQVGAPPTIVAVGAGSLVVLALRRPRLALGVVPVVLVCLANLILVGRPMFHFGFHWLANANSDMAYYVLSATSLLHHGLVSPIDVAGLAQNRNFATSVYALHSLGVREGADITLAAFAATTGRSPTDLYMPMILSLNLCAICATGSLAMQFARKWWAATLASALLAISPLAAYGVLQQLLPQVWGLALAAALVALLMRPAMHQKPGPSITEIVPVCLLAVGLFAVYVELAATLSGSYALYVALLALRRRVSLRALLRLWIPPIVVTAIVINTYLFRELHYLIQGAHDGVRGSIGVKLFGYALVPTALPGIIGLRSLSASPSAAYAGPSILAALILLVGAFFAALMSTLKGSAASVVVLGDFALGALLAYKGSDFGLFKLYMYAQPFLAAAVACWFSSLSRRPAIVGAGVLLASLAAFQLHTQNDYVAKSRSPIDLPHASEADLLPAFRSFLRRTHDALIPITDNFTLATLEGASAGHKRLYFVSRNVFNLPWKNRSFRMPSPTNDEQVVFGENSGAARVLASGRCSIAMPTGSQLVLNRRALPEGSRDLVALDCAKARNILVFVVSSVGQPFSIPATRSAVSFWQLEPDYFYPGHTFSGFGRYALFQILRPSSSVRLELNFSTSLIQNRSRRLPPVTAVGGGRVRFPVIGNGSAHVYSPPLRPQMIDGQPYVLLDMGENGGFPPVSRPGVTGLWERSIPLDPRRLTSYIRDVSLVSGAQYRELRAPSMLDSFPADLTDRGLEYSGIYEDGWVGQDSYAMLAGGDPASLVVRAEVLQRSGQHLRVLVDGHTVASRSVKGGSLQLGVPVPASRARRRVELIWSGDVALKAPDSRRAAARLDFLGLSHPPSSLRRFPADLADPGLIYSGIFNDGWLQKVARMTLAGGRAGKLTLHAQVAIRRGQHLNVVMNHQLIASRRVGPGQLELSIPIPATDSIRTIELRWSTTARLAANDPRLAAALLKYVTIDPKSQ